MRVKKDSGLYIGDVDVAPASGTVDITENGVHNVAPYKFADVDVPQPSGKINITENGTDIDVAQYALADVNVPQPSGTINITENGHHNVADYSDAIVTVPITEIQKSTTSNYYSTYEPIVPSFSNLYVENESGIYMIGGNACFANSLVENVYLTNAFLYIDDGSIQGASSSTVLGSIRGAFAYCKNLISVNIGQGGNFITIGDYAFTGCEKLERCSFLNFHSVGKYAFSNTSIGSVQTNRLYKIDNNAFEYSPQLTQLKITGVNTGNDDSTIESYAFRNCGNLQKIILNGSTDLTKYLQIKSNAFSDNRLRITTFAVLSNNVVFDANSFYNVDLSITNFYTHLNQSDFTAWLNNLSDNVLKAAIQNATITYEYSGDGSEL